MRQKILIALTIIFAIIFLVSLVYLARYFSLSKKNARLYAELAQIVEENLPEETLTPAEITTGPNGETMPLYSDVIDPETGETIQVLPEYARIYEMNNHLVGWITIDSTVINYPVLQNPDQKDYYLKRDFYRNSSSYGAIYVQENCDVFTPSDNLVLYGHRMKDGSMFAALHNYKEKSFYQEHPYIQFDTIKERHTYQIVSVFLISSMKDNPFQYHLFTDAQSPEEFDQFIKNCSKYALYDTGVSAQYGDKLITLSTCEYSNLNGRLVVVAKQIS